MTAGIVWMLAALWTGLNQFPPLPAGPFEGEALVASDPVEGRFGTWALLETEAGALLADLDGAPQIGRGDRLYVRGQIRGNPGRRGSLEYRAQLEPTSVEVHETSRPVHVAMGDAVRDQVTRRLTPFDDSRGLLAGFLIGDTSELSSADVEAMRLSGLSHFVAVSGSNVALFLGLLALAAGPLALGPKRRAIVGLAGLPIYAAATRFEPSVLRASFMAALALGGRLVGVVFEAWQLLAAAVVCLLLLDPELSGNAGFQMSVAATAGVLVGARWPVSGSRVRRALAVTIGAQVGVSPLLLAHFGTLPLLSPLVNLVASPLVAASTLIGAVGVAVMPLAVDVASWLAGLVLSLARGAASWPQIQAPGGAIVVGLLLASIRWPRARLVIALGATVGALLLVLGPPRGLPDTGAVVLDVGQGDAILIHGGGGAFALVDGGPHQAVLVDRLRRYGVNSLQLVVMTHVHADHVDGLTALPGRVPIGLVWMRSEPHETEASARFRAGLATHGIATEEVRPGTRFRLGRLVLEVEGPLRRYASPNDQSIVIEVVGAERSMLLSGDIETVAQAELGSLRADVLKVPHQGAATSSPDWLAQVGADLAVISVGPNQFGHPVEWVIDVLRESGASVLRTDLEGDIAVDLG